jgi:hypothetical protein
MTIKTAQERVEETAHRLSNGELRVSIEEIIEQAMQAEIEELRAALDAWEKQEPAAWINDKREMYLHRVDAVRESQDGALSDEEIDEIGVDFDGDYQTLRAFARRIEVAVKGEK